MWSKMDFDVHIICFGPLGEEYLNQIRNACKSEATATEHNMQFSVINDAKVGIGFGFSYCFSHYFKQNDQFLIFIFEVNMFHMFN